MTDNSKAAEAELDYAYLADYAQVSDGKITAVGASFTFVNVVEFPTIFPLAIAGRIRVPIAKDTVRMRIEITPPDGEYELALEGDLIASSPKPYDDKVGLLFAVNTQLPINKAGLFVFNIEVDGKFARRLAFEVEG